MWFNLAEWYPARQCSGLFYHCFHPQLSAHALFLYPNESLIILVLVIWYKSFHLFNPGFLHYNFKNFFSTSLDCSFKLFPLTRLRYVAPSRPHWRFPHGVQIGFTVGERNFKKVSILLLARSLKSSYILHSNEKQVNGLEIFALETKNLLVPGRQKNRFLNIFRVYKVIE